jgi:hypothetical protein
VAALAGLGLVAAGAAVTVANTPDDIVRVELAGDPISLQRLVIGERSEADAVANIQAYLDSLPYDRYVFIPAYVVGLGLVLWVGRSALPGRRLRRLSSILLGATVLAGLLDLVEDHGLAVALAQLGAHPLGPDGVSGSWLAIAKGAAIGKFVLLGPAAAVGLAAGIAAVRRSGHAPDPV